MFFISESVRIFVYLNIGLSLWLIGSQIKAFLFSGTPDPIWSAQIWQIFIFLSPKSNPPWKMELKNMKL